MKLFKSFLLRLILEDAIAFEEKSYLFYERAFESAVMVESRELLKKLLSEELRHRMKLEDMHRKGDMGELKVSNPVEIKDIEEMSLDWPPINPWSSKNEILDLALQKEKNAYKFYRTMVKKTTLKRAKEIFEALSQEEYMHMQWIQSEMRKNEEVKIDES